ncbi:MAG TPA: hypothetical protein VGF94_08150 [Kofleriaceae bacterium]|jgi:hypothetical protein
MRQLQLSDLRARALEQADLDTDLQFTGAGTSPLVNGMGSAQYGDLCGVVAGTGLRYFESTQTAVMDGTTNVITEPTAILSLVDTIERVYDPVNGRLRRLRPIAPQERAYWAGRTGYARVWELVDRQLLLYPKPPANDQYILRFIPQPPDLRNAADNTMVDVVCPDGESFMIWGWTVRALAKARSDVTLALAERDAARDRLAEWAALRLFHEPPRIMPEDDSDLFPMRDGSWSYDR